MTDSHDSAGLKIITVTRESYDRVCGNSNMPWYTSDHDRHTRDSECRVLSTICRRPYTPGFKELFQENSNWGKGTVGCCNGDRRDCMCCIVPSTKASDFSHAAIQLTKRDNFTPTAKYSDKWPDNKEYWEHPLGPMLAGRLGLFHFVQRIIKTRVARTHRNSACLTPFLLR